MGGWRMGRLAAPIVAAALLVAGSCFAGGATAVADSPPTWAITAGPHRSGTNDLQSISCVSADDCVTVGFHGTDGPYRTMAQTWDGATWSGSSPRNAGADENWLNSVSCVTATFCMAVGFHGSVSRPLAESFDGTGWSRLQTPRLGRGATGVLSSISCVSTTWCTAVGEISHGSTMETALIETWAGAQWQLQTSPPRAGRTDLTAVSCSSATQCAAVGAGVTSDSYAAVIEAWEGEAWTVSASVDPGSANFLNAVSCPTATRCVAVGDDYGPSGTEPTLIEVWDGTSWTSESTPTQGPAGINWLNGVSCADATDCVAVGGFDQGHSRYRNLIASWDGTDWSIVASPDQGQQRFNTLTSVSCPEPASCRAVGGAGRRTDTTRPLHLTESPPAGA